MTNIKQKITDYFGKQDEDSKIKRLNFYFVMLIFFVVAYLFTYFLTKEDDSTQEKFPLIIYNIEPGYNTNYFDKTSTNSSEKIQGNYSRFDVGDFVSVKYFNVKAVVLEKHVLDLHYKIIYMDQNHVLREIVLPEDMLIKLPKQLMDPFYLMN